MRSPSFWLNESAELGGRDEHELTFVVCPFLEMPQFSIFEIIKVVIEMFKFDLCLVY